MALMPEYLQGLPEELESLAEQLERDILEDAARRIAKTGQITDTAAYQLARVKEMGASREYITKRLAEFTKMSEEVIERLIFDAAQTDSEFYEEFYRKLGKDYTPFEYNEYLQQMTRACINQTMGELTNLTQSMGFAMRASDGRTYFTPTATAYQRTMDEAEMLVASGGVDYQTAVRRATAKLTASGLQFVDYATGHRNHVDVAVRRALLTGIGQMTGKIAESNAAQLDTDVVETTAHQGARPDHSVWQGRWFSLHGKDKRYPLLSRETGYGTVTGLKGANCRHDFFPVVPGISQPAYTDEQLQQMNEPVTVNGVEMPYYEAEQKQRAMERAIRKTKRELICADASGDEERFKEKSILLRRQRQAYKEFSRDANIPMRGERLGVQGYGRGVSNKSVWAEKKDNKAKSNIDTNMSNKTKNNLIKILGNPNGILLTKQLQNDIIYNNDIELYGLVFISNRDDLYKYAKKLAPYKDYVDVVFHADRDSFLILDPETDEILQRVSPEDLANLLLNSNNYKRGQKIRLLSCQAGYGDNSIAKQLATLLGVDVIAPTEILAISNVGESFISDSFVLIDMWTEGLDVKQTGQWKHFSP